MKKQTLPKPPKRSKRPKTDAAFHEAFMTDPSRWPRHPLPLTRKSGQGDCALGLLFAIKGAVKPEVVLANMLEPDTWGSALRISYNSLKDLVADGWKVD